MSDNKFTTAETLEALACCSEDGKCHSCPYNGTECLHGLPIDALAVINRQKADRVQLEDKYNKAVAEREANIKGFTEALKTIKNEVAREIFRELEKLNLHVTNAFDLRRYEELKKKYTEDK